MLNIWTYFWGFSWELKQEIQNFNPKYFLTYDKSFIPEPHSQLGLDKCLIDPSNLESTDYILES